MQENFEKVRVSLGKAATCQKKYYDLRAVERSFIPGDWVLHYYPPERSRRKLNSPNIGPYLVLKTLGEVTYLVQRSPTAEPISVHVDDLHKYLGVTPTSWLQPVADCRPTLVTSVDVAIQCTGVMVVSDHSEDSDSDDGAIAAGQTTNSSAANADFSDKVTSAPICRGRQICCPPKQLGEWTS